MRRAALVIVGSRFLADYARAAGAAKVVQVPTVVDLDRYHRQRPRSGTAIPQVCWIGQQSTAAFLQPLAPMFAQLSRSGAMSFTAIGIDAAAASLPMDSVEWSEASEAAVIARCDIGIMPLPDTPFERGKCGYKLIQYMACGLPVVASPVGANRDIVEHGVNGFLVQTEGEWRDALLTLAADAELRRKMGEAGRIKVEQGFALQVASTEITALLAGLIRR